MSKSKRRYQITLTEEQMAEISHALEVVARLNDMALGCCLDEKGRPINDYETTHYIESLIKPMMGLDSNASWGVGKFEKTDMIWDMVEVLRNRISWERAVENGLVESIDSKRDWSNMMGVSYDEPMQWNKNVPLIKIEKVEETKE